MDPEVFIKPIGAGQGGFPPASLAAKGGDVRNDLRLIDLLPFPLRVAAAKADAGRAQADDPVQDIAAVRLLIEGDIALYQKADGSYILHRVIRLSASSVCLCCGDAQWEGEQVDEAQIIAYVTAFRRKGRWRETALSRPYRLYEHFWVHTFPARRPLLRLLRFLQRARRGLIRGRR